jgi:hypothetical protein
MHQRPQVKLRNEAQQRLQPALRHVNLLIPSFGGKKATTTLFWREETQMVPLPTPVEHPL